MPEHQDDGEAFCEGDLTLDDIDLEDLVRLGEFIEHVQSHVEAEGRRAASILLLHGMYGEDLIVPT